MVLEILEDCIRAVSSNDLVRDGRRITFFGLGPSPRAINHRDTTVIDVKAENGGTTIDADVRFQASAFLGEARQDVVVQEKLDRIFRSMLTRLGLDELADSANGHKPHAIVEPVQPIEEFHPASEHTQKLEPEESLNEAGVVRAEAQAEALPEIVPAVEPELVAVKTAKDVQSQISPRAEAATVAVIERAPEPTVAKSAEPEAPQVVDTKGDVPVVEPTELPIAAKSSLQPVASLAPKILQQDGASSEEKKTGEPEATTRSIAVRKIEPRPRIKFESLLAEPEVIVSSSEVPQVVPQAATAKSSIPHRFSSFEGEEGKSSGWLKGTAWVAALVVLVLAPAAWLYLPRHLQEEAPQPQPAPAAVSQAAPVPQPAVVAPAPEQPGANEDPAVVVSQWETAMQSRDAAAQAAFYANPVERYFLRHNVSKEDVLADRQSAIEKRKGIWTVKMERVKITHPKDATARVSLIKHYMVQEEGSPVSEWFVPSVVLLVREDGRWQITSERDLGWAASMDELEE
jgi:ketosteroid isomerase-like protein